MAIKSLVFKCDWCETEMDEYEEVSEAVQEGWWLIESPRGDVCFCSTDCLEAWL